MGFKRKVIPKGPLPVRYVFLLTFVFFVFSTAGGLFIINKGIEPTLSSYAEAQTKKIATLVINNAITKKVIEENDLNDIITIVPNPNGTGNPIKDYDPAKVIRVQGETENLILKNLKEAEKGNLADLESLTDVDIKMTGRKSDGLVFYVPLGQATNISLLGNLGPKVPVKFQPVSSVSTTVDHKIEEWGINNAFIHLYVHIEVNVQMILPFASKKVTVKRDIPLGMENIEGEVPEYFNNGGSTAPAIELPKKNKK
ncbi:sporulation protein YunB [Peribacillus sp. SCS-155]|uniref:sporulation protein YunB n=1 Tax=Peribacillus sedimenti TaxID=3115297 RepID=UPI003905DF00